MLPNGIAYFSMEFGVAEVLPNYSGGLGILAGDHLKSASDLGLPLIAVGLYYRSGYFRQSLTADGWQHESYPSLDPQGLPLRLLTDAGGEAILVELAMPGGVQLSARIWIAQVGRIPLLLLDSDIPENEHDLRGVTDRLYGGDQEHRIRQEILAGIGGVRAIRAFTEVEGLPSPEVFHMNEGHAGFLGDLFDARTDLLHGTLDMLILRTLQWGTQHGYAIAQTIRAQSSEVLQVEAGSLYPALQRLAKRGWVTSKWGQTDANQRAKFYRLTPEGKKQLLREESRWAELVAAIGRVMDPAGTKS